MSAEKGNSIPSELREKAERVIAETQARRREPGRVFVVAGPSGVGKTTLCKHALERLEARLKWSVSHTTRPQRQGERDGIDYHFVAREKFEQMIAADAFVEHAEVHGNFYGTSRAELDRIRKSGSDALVEIDVQGALQIIQKDPGAVTVFVLPPSSRALEQRLYGRGTDSDDIIARRLRNAFGEIAQADRFTYRILNEDLAQATEDLIGIIRAQPCRWR